jgi:hypothetical protein
MVVSVLRSGILGLGLLTVADCGVLARQLQIDPPARWASYQVCTSWQSYVNLHMDACRFSVAVLRHLQPIPEVPSSKTLIRSRASLYASALLRFHFIYGDFIRWLSGEYTNRHRNWTKDFAIMLRTASRPLMPDYPVPDYPRAFRINTEGVPLEANFTTPASEIPARDYYDNHPAVGANHANVEAKFVKEEAKSFHIQFPRFLIYFIQGLILAPLQWAMRKGKGRICVDCTNGPDPAGSVNTSIPKTELS